MATDAIDAAALPQRPAETVRALPLWARWAIRIMVLAVVLPVIYLWAYTEFSHRVMTLSTDHENRVWESAETQYQVPSYISLPWKRRLRAFFQPADRLFRYIYPDRYPSPSRWPPPNSR